MYVKIVCFVLSCILVFITDSFNTAGLNGTFGRSPLSLEEGFMKSLDVFERKLYWATFTQLLRKTPENREENGFSFVQSGLFLHLALLAFSTEVDEETRLEIEQAIGYKGSEEEKICHIRNALELLPNTNSDLKFLWMTRLVVRSETMISNKFMTRAAEALQMQIKRLEGSESPEAISKLLNVMVQQDSGGSIRKTFEDYDITESMKTILLSTLYFRARWRSAPTLLNGSALFEDFDSTSQREVRCMKINDFMRYTYLTEWNAEALEISYATPGLSLFILAPRGRSLRFLASRIISMNFGWISERMKSYRIAVLLPLYTLRMTLLIPKKLRAIGIHKLIDSNFTRESFTLSHAVQRIMFWAEAGRYAFKDDGLEWDEVPQMNLYLNRPHIFFIRWKNITIMNGNFVL